VRQVLDSYLIETYWLPIDFAWYRVNIRLPVILLGTYSHTSHIGRQPDIYHLIFKCEWQPGVEKTRDRRPKTGDHKPFACPRLPSSSLLLLPLEWLHVPPSSENLKNLSLSLFHQRLGPRRQRGVRAQVGTYLHSGTWELESWATGELGNRRTEEPQRKIKSSQNDWANKWVQLF